MLDYAMTRPSIPDAIDEELLACVSALSGEAPPTLEELGRRYGISRQAAHKRVERLRRLGLVEQKEDGRAVTGVRLTGAARLLLEIGLDGGSSPGRRRRRVKAEEDG